MSNLTNPQEIFVRELFKTNNQRQSYLKAYPHKKNWKDTSIDVAASVLSKKDKVVQRLQVLRERAAKASEITVESITKEILNIATVRECDFYHDDGSVKQLSELDDKQKAALSEYTIKTVKDGKDENGKQQYKDIPVFKAHDKNKALDMLMKHIGGYAPKKIEHSDGPRRGMNNYYDQLEEEAADDE